MAKVSKMQAHLNAKKGFDKISSGIVGEHSLTIEFLFDGKFGRKECWTIPNTTALPPYTGGAAGDEIDSHIGNPMFASIPRNEEALVHAVSHNGQLLANDGIKIMGDHVRALVSAIIKKYAEAVVADPSKIVVSVRTTPNPHRGFGGDALCCGFAPDSYLSVYDRSGKEAFRFSSASLIVA